MARGPSKEQAQAVTRRYANRLAARLRERSEVIRVDVQRAAPWQSWLPCYEVRCVGRVGSVEETNVYRVRTIRASNGEAAVITEPRLP
jgi:hypothetical protein